jgi:hypothetical protein
MKNRTYKYIDFSFRLQGNSFNFSPFYFIFRALLQPDSIHFEQKAVRYRPAIL